MVKTATSQNGDSQNGDTKTTTNHNGDNPKRRQSKWRQRKLKCFYIYTGTSVVTITISDRKKLGGKAIMGTVVVTL